MAVLWNNTCKLNFLLKGPECYKDTQMKAYDITKLTAELKSDFFTVYCFVACFVGIHTYSKLIYCTMIVGRRQVTVQFMN